MFLPSCYRGESVLQERTEFWPLTECGEEPKFTKSSHSAPGT